MTMRARGPAHRWCLPGAQVVVLSAAAVLVSSCAGDGATERPTGAASRTATASLTQTATSPAATRTQVRTDTQTRTTPATSPADTQTPTQPEIISPRPTPTETPRPTESPRPTETPRPTESPRPTETVTATVTATSTMRPTPEEPSSPVSEPATTAPTTATGSTTDASGAPTWLWWLLAALVLTAAIATPLVVRGRRRRAWDADLAAAVDEVAWFARVLVPELRQAATVEQVRGGWAVGEDRVAAVEDRLTALAATAHDDADRMRVQGLRDVVRASRQRIEDVSAPGVTDPSQELERVAVDLETALAAASAAGTPTTPENPV
jgi:hypothetical protein